MKTVFINCSPKKNLSSSSYLAFILRLFVKGEKLTKKLRSKKDYEGILEELKSAENIVLCLPLYVDGLLLMF